MALMSPPLVGTFLHCEIDFPLLSDCVMFTWFDHLEETFPSSCFLYNRSLYSFLFQWWDQLITFRCKGELISIVPRCLVALREG